MIDTFLQYIREFPIEKIFHFANSQFFSSIIGALAGAFAGASAAHRIGTSARKREDLEAQLRAVNVAITSSFLTCNSVLGLKGHQVLALYDEFIADKARYGETLKSPPPGGGKVEFQTDLKTLHMPFVPFDEAVRNIQEHITIKGRPLALAPTILNALNSLRGSLEYRNRLIDEFKTLFPKIPGKATLDYYFGFPLPDGSVHQEYSDTIEAIYQNTDDVIFFSSLLCSDLVDYGNQLRALYKKQFGRNPEKVTSPDFKTPKAEKLMPDEKRYADWMSMFHAHEEGAS